MIARLLDKFSRWALSKNAPGPYVGEDDPRWAYTIETDGQPYLTRVLLSSLLGLRSLFGLGVFLHHFHRPDADRHLHNHPWRWAFSIVISGAYDEERLDDCVTDGRGGVVTLTTRHVVRWFNALTDRDYHRVERLRGDVWTLFVTGPRVQDWGFLVDGEHLSWREFLKDR